MIAARTVGILLLAAVAIYARAPAVWLSPRFWAEEGALIYSYAYRHGGLSALVAPHVPYACGIANAVTLIAARAVSVEAGPWITTLTALACQLVPLLIVLSAPSPFWATDARRPLVCALILFTPTGEIWLTTPSAMFHFSLAAALLLLIDPEAVSRRQRMAHRVILALAGISGPIPSLLLPVFLVAAWIERSAERWRQATIIGMGLVLQAAAFGYWVWTHGLPGDRMTAVLRPAAVRVFVDSAIAHPFLFHDFYSQYPRLVWIVAAAACIVLGAAWRDHRFRLAIAASFALSILSLLTSIETRGGERYFFASGVLMVIVCAAFVPRLHRRMRLEPVKIVALLLVVCALVRSVMTFERRMELFDQPAGSPSWRSEVARWRQDPTYQPRVPPYWGPPWRVRLDRSDRDTVR